jgi:RHS repeat-associated protein
MAKLGPGGNYSIVTDHLGTPVGMLDESGESVWSADINTFGRLRNLEGDAQACPFRWPGQYEDAETGLYYNRFRYYDPDAGQYVSQDPIGLRGGLQLRSYVQDPSVWLDPLGLLLSNREIGEIGERAAKRRLRRQGHSILGSVENTSGHGVDIVSRNPNGDIEVHEVKANSSRLNKHQRKGANAYAERQNKRANRRSWRHKGPRSRPANDALTNAIEKQGTVKGSVIRVEVDRNTGKVGKITQKKWKKCP